MASKIVFKANLDQQKKVLQRKKNNIVVLSNTVASQTGLVCKSVDWFLYKRQTLQG